MNCILKFLWKLEIGSIDNLSDLKMSKIEYLSNENGYIYIFFKFKNSLCSGVFLVLVFLLLNVVLLVFPL